MTVGPCQPNENRSSRPPKLALNLCISPEAKRSGRSAAVIRFHLAPRCLACPPWTPLRFAQTRLLAVFDWTSKLLAVLYARAIREHLPVSRFCRQSFRASSWLQAPLLPPRCDFPSMQIGTDQRCDARSEGLQTPTLISLLTTLNTLDIPLANPRRGARRCRNSSTLHCHGHQSDASVVNALRLQACYPFRFSRLDIHHIRLVQAFSLYFLAVLVSLSEALNVHAAPPTR